MKMVAVKSSMIHSVGYDPGSKAMRIAFHGGNVTQYEGVPAHLHAALMSAPSVGKHFNQNFRYKFEGKRI